MSFKGAEGEYGHGQKEEDVNTGREKIGTKMDVQAKGHQGLSEYQKLEEAREESPRGVRQSLTLLTL